MKKFLENKNRSPSLLSETKKKSSVLQDYTCLEVAGEIHISELSPNCNKSPSYKMTSISMKDKGENNIL